MIRLFPFPSVLAGIVVLASLVRGIVSGFVLVRAAMGVRDAVSRLRGR